MQRGVCRDEQVSRPAIDAVRHVLSDGSWAELALEAVQLVADLIRKRKCSCAPQVLLPERFQPNVLGYGAGKPLRTAATLALKR